MNPQTAPVLTHEGSSEAANGSRSGKTHELKKSVLSVFRAGKGVRRAYGPSFLFEVVLRPGNFYREIDAGNIYAVHYWGLVQVKKSLSFRQLQKKLDRIFSEFIRLRDADANGYVRCITCGKVYFWRDIHNGHYCERARFSTRFNEQNCHAQCKNCNWTHEGQKMIYREKLVELYGEQEVKKLETISHISGGDDSISLMYKIEEYQQKVKALKKIKAVNRP